MKLLWLLTIATMRTLQGQLVGRYCLHSKHKCSFLPMRPNKQEPHTALNHTNHRRVLFVVETYEGGISLALTVWCQTLSSEESLQQLLWVQCYTESATHFTLFADGFRLQRFSKPYTNVYHQNWRIHIDKPGSSSSLQCTDTRKISVF